ncbi:CoA-binding protein [Cellulophaga baltica]|uniref:CoA-binding protein n=1 Tax=Cellulophaga TaxID=104264 RepID=UPI001C06EAC7|nr:MULTISPECIES: CoA-binding protein [Cellulophaga]MBU2998056.1 CoA-binding protein [Cellulophaga baltica]MDO6769458.1 CoA-binding protein [Cellulophaga sp. 1_MG-2023]
MPKTLVIGASLKPERYSNIAVKRLVENSIKTEAYGLKEGKIGSVQIKTNFTDLQNIHTVTLYLNPKRQVYIYDDILNLKPKRVIFNPRTENVEFYNLLEKQGIEVEVACTLVLLATNQYN